MSLALSAFTAYDVAQRSRATTADAVLPALIASAGDRAVLRFVEYFTANIRNCNTRAAYGRAAADFLRWCEGPGRAVEPVALRPGPRHSVMKGSTPVLSSEEATALLAGMDVSTVVRLLDIP
jgi:hypothetical protein